MRKVEFINNSDSDSGDRRNFIVPEKEEYTCEHCGEIVAGGGYKNHCPHCLWSKHLDDKVPGDRGSECQGLMDPVGATQKKGVWRIIHICTLCDKRTVVDSSPKDNFNLIIELAQKPLLEE